MADKADNNEIQNEAKVGDVAASRNLYADAAGDNLRLVNDKPLTAAGLSPTEVSAVHTQLASFQAGNIAIAKAGA